MNVTLSAGLEKVRLRFLSELVTRRALIDDAFSRLDDEASKGAAIEEICSVAHKIAGTAGTLGFQELGAQAAKTEDAIRERLAGGAIDDAEVRTQIVQLIDVAKQC